MYDVMHYRDRPRVAGGEWPVPQAVSTEARKQDERRWCCETPVPQLCVRRGRPGRDRRPGRHYSANQLAYQYAFNQDNFNGAAAISIDLLVAALICATVLIA